MENTEESLGNHRQLKQDILNCLRDQEASLSHFKQQIQDKDVIIFLGSTRSGKSTLVNYIIGTELEAWKSGKMEFKIREAEGSNGPGIGHTSLSHTTLPGVYPVQGSDEVVVDPPGFEDNRGVVQDIINALCISQIKVARTVKFILVCDINDIDNDNIRNFTNSLEQVQALVCNVNELRNSFAVVFTKDWKNYTQAEIIELLYNKILNVDQYDVDSTLIENFATNERFIGIFKMPRESGKISNELDVNVKDAIRACDPADVERCTIKFALSDKAQEALLQIYPEYTDSNFFENEVTRITEEHAEYFTIDKYVFASYDNELSSTKTSLEKILVSLGTHRDRARDHLYEVQRSLDELLDEPVCREFRTNFKFVTMLDESGMLDQNHKTSILTNYVNSLSRLFTKVDDLLRKINAEQQERKRNNIVFTVAGIAAFLGIVPGSIGLMKAVECATKAGCTVARFTRPGAAAFGACEGAIGTTATYAMCSAGMAVAGAGAGSAYVLYKQTYGKRMEARGEQNR